MIGCLYVGFFRVFSSIALGGEAEGQQGAFNGAQVLHAQLHRPDAHRQQQYRILAD